jgi:hypothetical protein
MAKTDSTILPADRTELLQVRISRRAKLGLMALADRNGKSRSHVAGDMIEEGTKGAVPQEVWNWYDARTG